MNYILALNIHYNTQLKLSKEIIKMTSPSSVVNVFTGEKGRQYYQVSTSEGFYDINFPLNIALECSANNSRMGPQHCNNCKDYGSYNDITLLLCLNCADLCCANKQDRCSCDNVQGHLDEQLQHFNSDSDDGFMCIGCEFGAKCNLHLWYSDVNVSLISLSYEHYELVSYRGFMRKNSYHPIVQIDDDISYIEPVTDMDTDTDTDTGESVDCISSSSTEDTRSIFSIEEDDIVDLTAEVCDMTFQYDEELLKQFPLVKKKLQLAAQRRDVEATQFEEYDYLHWHYEQLNKEYNSLQY